MIHVKYESQFTLCNKIFCKCNLKFLNSRGGLPNKGSFQVEITSWVGGGGGGGVMKN